MERNSNKNRCSVSVVCLVVFVLFAAYIFTGCRSTGAMVLSEQPGAGGVDEAILAVREQTESSAAEAEAAAESVRDAQETAGSISGGLQDLEAILCNGSGEGEQFRAIVHRIQGRSADPDERSSGGNRQTSN